MSKFIEGIHYKSNKPVALQVDSGVISEILELPDLKSNQFVAPGLVDLQINGFKGIDFNETGLSKEQLLTITQELFKVGVTGYFPTLITNSRSRICKTLEVLTTACENSMLLNDCLMGIHLEGPFLSSEDGPRGAHPIAHIQPPDWDLFCKWQDKAQGRIKIITLAPELPGSLSFIEKCRGSGVCVAIGHTAATPEEIRSAVKAGAQFSTHLGNASHLMLPRHENYIWEQLASEKLWATLIADGFHLPEAILSVFWKVKRNKRIVISDSTRFAGLTPGFYQSHIGGAVELEENGRLSMQSNPNMLAGSAKSLLDCVNHLIRNGIDSVSNAIDSASLKPLEMLKNSSINGIKEGSKADLIVFERDRNMIKIIKTIKAGVVVHSCDN